MISLLCSLVLFLILTTSGQYLGRLLFELGYSLEINLVLTLGLNLVDLCEPSSILFGLCCLTVFGLVYLRRKNNVLSP